MTLANHPASSVELNDAPAWRARLAALWSNPWFGAAFLFLASMLYYLPEANRVPHVDELYHLLAADGVLAEGVPRIADGLYPRAELFTRLVAGSIALFGDHPLSARLPALLAGGLLVAAVFLWTRAVAGNLAAWIAAGFLCLAPISAQLFLWVRFYTLFALALWLGALGVYALATQPRSWPRDAALGAGCVVAFALAWHLQPLTLLGLAGIGVWLAAAIVLPWLWRRLGTRGRRWGSLAAGAAIAAVAAVLVVAAVGTGSLQELWQEYRWSPLHSIEHRNAVWFYHLLMLKDYPTLWSVVPLLSLLALAVRPQPALFCTIVFVVILALLSFAGMKDARYLFFALPFLFVPWGIALASGLTAAARWVVATTDRAVAGVAPALPRRSARWALLVVTALFVIGANGASTKAALRFFGVIVSTEGDGIAFSREGDGVAWQVAGAAWQAARAPLDPWLRQASVVVTTGEEYTLYYYGDYDVLINLSRLDEVEQLTGAGAEFSIDPRTGRPVIGTAESVALLMSCYPDGLVLTHVNHWGRDQSYTMDQATASLILDRTEPVELPEGVALRVFHWRNPSPVADPACPALPTRPHPAGG